jgi:hypothetical protein
VSSSVIITVVSEFVWTAPPPNTKKARLNSSVDSTMESFAIGKVIVRDVVSPEPQISNPLACA